MNLQDYKVFFIQKVVLLLNIIGSVSLIIKNNQY